MRYCFLLKVRPELLDEYRSRHGAVWPEMLQALKASDWNNYSIFAREDGLLVGYVESDDLERAQNSMARTNVNTRWQADMSRFFTVGDGRRPDEAMEVLEEIFNLEDQLASLEPAEPAEPGARP